MEFESKSELAAAKKRSGEYNCAQAVACTYADVVGADESLVRAATSAFGTGMGNMNGTCGALVGAGVILGIRINDRVLSRSAMKRIMTAFQAKNGATICRELKGVGTGCPLRACDGCVADAAQLLEDELRSL